MIRRILLSMVSSTVLLGAASAQQQSFNIGGDDKDLSTFGGGFYGRVGGGVGFVGDLERNFTYNPSTVFPAVVGTPIDRSDIDLDTGWVASAAIGFDFDDGIRTELEYRYALNEINTVTTFGRGAAGPNAPVSSSDDVRGHFVFSNFYYDFRNGSPITPFVGLGIGGAFIEQDLGERDEALAYQGRAGVSYNLGGDFFADLEYVYVRTNTLRFGPRTDDFEPGRVEPAIDADNYQSSSVMLSIRTKL